MVPEKWKANGSLLVLRTEHRLKLARCEAPLRQRKNHASATIETILAGIGQKRCETPPGAQSRNAKLADKRNADTYIVRANLGPRLFRQRDFFHDMTVAQF